MQPQNYELPRNDSDDRVAVLASAAVAGFLFVVLAGKDAPASFAVFNDGSPQAAEEKADALVEEITERPLFTSGRQKPEVKVVKAEPPVLRGRSGCRALLNIAQ